MSVRPVRLQLSRGAGFDLQALSRATNGLPARSVTRPSPFGNWYRVVEEGTDWWCMLDRTRGIPFRTRLAAQAHAVALFRIDVDRSRDFYWRAVEELRDLNLACTCPFILDGAPCPCHADVLIEVANG